MKGFFKKASTITIGRAQGRKNNLVIFCRYLAQWFSENKPLFFVTWKAQKFL
jgi:hypothetical protein